jgi:hypothetical protein
MITHKFSLVWVRQTVTLAPFYISLLVNGLILHNCMLDSRASTNVMTLEIMHELGLQISKPYRNVQAMDSREVQVCGVIKDLEVCLQVCPVRVLTMDVVVIDCPVKWGMLLSRKWAADVGGSIQMDWSYADISITLRHKVRLFREQKMLHHVEDPQQLDNEPLYPEVVEPELGAYVVTDDQEEPVISLPVSVNDGLWTMQFDGAWSRFGSGVGVVLITPSGMVFPYSFHLEFDCTNNMAEYEALLLGLQRARKMGIKQLKVEGDSKLIVNQVKKQCEARNPRLKRYRDAVWGEIDCFDTFNITVVPSVFQQVSRFHGVCSYNF